MPDLLSLALIVIGLLLIALLLAWFKQREKQLREEIDLLDTTFSGLDLMLVIIDRNRKVRKTNARFRESRFNAADEHIKNGMSVKSVFPEWLHQDIDKFTERAFNGKTVVTEKQLEGGRQPSSYEIGFAPIYRKESQTPVGCSISLKDVTELSITHRLLYEAKQEALQAAQSKTDFLSTMSHEIRTPMNAVIGLTNLLLADNPRDDQREHLETIKFSGDNLLHIINDILDYNKIESGNLSLEHIDYDLRNMIDKLTRVLKNKAESKGIYLKTELDEKMSGWIKGDQVRLNQVLTNLIGNGIKFTKEGGVTLRIRVVDDSIEGRQTLRFEVIDTGIGIPRDKQAAVFERFTQADTNTTRNFGGTGLGLAICKKLTEAFESKLKLESEPGKGSNFYFDMDVEISVSPEALESASDPTHIEKDLRGGLILLAEDNEINVLVIGEYLKQWNARFDVAENGKIAIEKAKEQQYELVLMDLQMPEMDGYEATKGIRALSDPVKANIPIYALTADAMVEIKERVMESGMNGIFHKPFDPESVYRTLYREMIGS